MGEAIEKNSTVYYQEWTEGILEKSCEKFKASAIKNNTIDYNDFNSGTFEKYLEVRSKQQNDLKSNQIKSKYFTLEYAKKLKSKNTEGFYDTVKNMHVTNNFIKEKPEIISWENEDVINFFVKLNFSQYENKIKENNIDGNMLMNLQVEELFCKLEIEKKDVLFLTKSLSSLKKIFYEKKNLRSNNIKINDNVSSEELQARKYNREGKYNKQEKNMSIDLITEENNKSEENISLNEKVEEEDLNIQKDEEPKDNNINKEYNNNININNAEFLRELNSPSIKIIFINLF